jgi:hypothetical protein
MGWCKARFLRRFYRLLRIDFALTVDISRTLIEAECGSLINCGLTWLTLLSQFVNFLPSASVKRLLIITAIATASLFASSM